MDIGAYLAAFFADLRVQAVIWLVIVHTLVKIADAIRTGTFDWRLVAEFYQKRVVPYMLGAAAMYLASKFIPSAVLGPYAELVGEGMFTLAWLFLVSTIVADLIAALKALGYPIPDRSAPPHD